ncbi:putative transcriptional regulator [Caldisphaera lagunensis DSM 15908]|uniref:Putative transcriptional regulator n=1 Tax=Caldisphaera lagunensis (strain DSM 15908 / JCM 11604 / ANMR 0165 / IC-154) TaxID=1056495 RepID=L0ABD8_CALLD|nr:PadR family transcriptional regulator [Caldisphaera lagunensis]AFZ70452.1 putative transcriptional regulator [Caldisphaera lagunensis DSM 15908]
MPKERKKMLKGIISLMILKILYEKPVHGYEMNKEISLKIGEELSPGYIYVLLKIMLKKGLIVAKQDSNVRGQRLTEYRITEKGIEFLKKHKNVLEKGKSMIDEILDTINKIEQKSS